MAFIYRTKTVSNILFPEQIKLELPPANKFKLKKKNYTKTGGPRVSSWTGWEIDLPAVS